MREDSHPTGCPCGRCQPAVRKIRKRADPEVYPHVTEALFGEAAVQGKVREGASKRDWVIQYAGDCQSPYPVKQRSKEPFFLTVETRCRKCNACLRARRNYWGFAAMRLTMEAEERGDRTWFGTLTLSPDAQEAMVLRAYERCRDDPLAPKPDWDNPGCDTRFIAVRDELVREVQKLFKRLRKAGFALKYFLVFERHKSGLPHMHFLLHEQGKRIRKRDIQGQWPWGFSNVSIVGGKSKRAAAPQRAAYYVAKYLSKSWASRPLASQGYRPVKRSRVTNPPLPLAP